MANRLMGLNLVDTRLIVDVAIGIGLVVLGAYSYLVGAGRLPQNPDSPDRMRDWQAKYGAIVKVGGAAAMIAGILRLIDVFI